MRVKELIALLETMDQEAAVEVYAGYDYEFGPMYKAEVYVNQEPSYHKEVKNIVYIE